MIIIFTDMSANEILKNIERLPLEERILLIEAAKNALQKSEFQQMEKAAKIMQEDYEADEELTAFQALNFETFYETR